MRLVRIVSALGLILAFACGDDSGGTGEDVDAGPTFDAAPRPDGDVRPTSGTCGIIVAPRFAEQGSPGIEVDLSGSTVVFSNPDGTEIETVTTNTKGEATSDSCVRDTMITAFAPYAFEGGPPPPPPSATGGGIHFGDDPDFPFVVTTFAGVQPDDTVFWGNNVIPEITFPYSRMNVSVPMEVSAEYPDAAYVQIRMGSERTSGAFASFTCDSNDVDHYFGAGSDITTPYWTRDIRVGCQQPDGTIDVLATLEDSDGRPYAYATVNDVTVVPGTSGDWAETPVVISAWTPVNADDLEIAVVIEDLPPGNDGGTARIRKGIDHVAFRDSGLGWSSGDVDSSTTFWGAPAGFANYGLINARSRYDFTDAARATEMMRSGPVAATNELSMAGALPRVAGVVVTSEIPTRPTVNWITDSSLEGANSAVITMAILPPGYDPEEETPPGFWVLVTPDASTGMTQAPVLPDSLLAKIFPESQLNVLPLSAAFFGFDYQTYGDLITARSFRPFWMTLPINRAWDFLPTPMPVETEGTAKGTYWFNLILFESLFPEDP